MTIAEIHGKWQSEDLLTADVFTAFQYLPAETGIVGFLRSIPDIGNVIAAPDKEAKCEFFFWPQGRFREPDVLLELIVDGRIYHVVIEAKYLSGPSDYELVHMQKDEGVITLGNQLADQLRGLSVGEYTVWTDGRRNKPKSLSSSPEHRLLLYLTAHSICPRDELIQARALFPVAATRLFWANWHQVYDYLTGQAQALSDFPYNRVVRDVLTLLKLKNFGGFDGVTPLPSMDMAGTTGAFWVGSRFTLPIFAGVRRPPFLGLAGASGSFWIEQQGRLTA